MTASTVDGWMSVMASSASDNWPTPQWVVDMLAAEFGPFDLDPAADAGNAKAPAFYTVTDNGLAQPWHGRVWLNPPYGRTLPQWTGKAMAEVDAGRAERVVCLLPARVDTRWYRQAAAAASLVRLWPGRLRFGVDAPGYSRSTVAELRNAPFASAVFVFGQLPGRHGTQPAWCAHCRGLFWPARSDARTCSARCRQAVKRSQLTGTKRDGGRS